MAKRTRRFSTPEEKESTQRREAEPVSKRTRTESPALDDRLFRFILEAEAIEAKLAAATEALLNATRTVKPRDEEVDEAGERVVEVEETLAALPKEWAHNIRGEQYFKRRPAKARVSPPTDSPLPFALPYR